MNLRKFIVFLVVTITIVADGSIFVLHRFDDERYPSTSISTKKLRGYFDYLEDNNYEVVPLEDMVAKVEAGEEIPNNWVSFTIDDAYRTFYENGLAIFKEYSYPFTLFVNTEAVEGRYPDFMTWDQLREAESYGSLANHSHTHLKLVNATNEEILEDTKIAKELLEKNLENPLNYYAYPYGEYDERVRKVINEAGMDVIFNQSTGAISENSNILDIDRIALGDNDNIASKLKINYLDAKWQEVEVVENKVENIRVSMPKEVKKVEVYLSGYGWEYAHVKEGLLEYNIDKPLKLNRSRIIIKDFNNNWTSYLIMKK